MPFTILLLHLRNLPGVAVAGGEAHEAVGKVVVVHESAKLAAEVGRAAHSAVPVANDGLSDERSEVVIVLPADTLDSNGDIGGGHGVVTDPDLGANEIGLGLLSSGDGGETGRGSSGEASEVLLSKLDELGMRYATSTDENHAVSSVVGLDVLLKVTALDGLDVLLGAEDGPAEGLALVSGSVQVVENNLLELLVNLLLLAEDDITLTLNGRGLELGVLENIGQDVDGVRDIGVEGLGVVDGVLALFSIRNARGNDGRADEPKCRR